VSFGYDPRAGRYVGGAAFGLPEPARPRGEPGELRLLVRFEHPAKFLAVAELPGAAFLGLPCRAAAYDAPADEVAAIEAELAAEVRAAARDLPSVAAVPSGTFVALGDSITDDVQSWAELLRHCLDPEVTVINAGISGDTTADALARLYGVVSLRPSLVVAMLGTNDCQRHGPGGAQLVPPEESLRHAREITTWLEAVGTRVIWLTPPPVDEAALAAAVRPRPLEVRATDVERVSDALLTSGLEVVDTALTTADLLPDGLHPSLSGQVKIARALLRHLAPREHDP
jgi:acyl-CoA thioesterase-1